MKWTAILISALLLAGCSRSAVPNLEDVPPTAMDSTAPAAAQSARQPDLSRAVTLTPAQRSDVERGVQRGLASASPPEFGGMSATASKITSKSYIVCGWVKAGTATAEYKPFFVLYVPEQKIALLIGVGGKDPEKGIRQRCFDEGAPLPS
jgi:hypothetical protein